MPADFAVLSEEGRQWLRSLPTIVADLERRWHVRTGSPFGAGTAGWVAPTTMDDGTPAVLKVGWPHREARDEAAGLRLWDGDGAVLVYEADPSVFALLVERCSPGTSLDRSGLTAEEALVIAADVLRRLWRPAPPNSPFERVADV